MKLGIWTAIAACGLLVFSACQQPFQDSGTAPAASSSGARALGSADFLKANGKSVRNNSGSGSIVALRGTNIGGWLVMENWMNPVDAVDQKIMRSVFSSRFGDATRDSLLKTYEDNYFTLADFDSCKAMGMNVLRLPFTYMNLLDNNGNLMASSWNRLDWFVNNASARGMYVILDLHGAIGSQNGADHSGDTSGANLWSSSANQDKTVWLWQQIAARYNGNAAVAGYDLLNEPTGGSGGLTGSMQWNFYNRLYQAIRAIDPNHMIIMESCWEANNLPNPSQYGWTNVMYEYHNYCWGADNDYAKQTAFTDSKVNAVNAANYNVPTYIGEFTVFQSIAAWEYTLAKYNAQGWSWTTWAYKATGSNNSWGIYNHNPPKVAIYSDSAATIQSKWFQVGLGNAWKYTPISDVVSKYLQQAPATKSIALRASANNLIVCADNAGASPLVANRAAVGGAWESYTLLTNSDGTVSFISQANSQVVCAENGGASPLIADKAAVGGSWEAFDLINNGDGTVSFKSRANGLYVCADLNLGGQLIANRTTIGGWEKFTIIYL